MISANGGLPAQEYTPEVTPRWPRGSEPADRGSTSEGRGAIADDGGADPVSSKSYERRIRRGTFVPSSAVPICWSRVKAQGKTGRVGIQLKATERAGDVKTWGCCSLR